MANDSGKDIRCCGCAACRDICPAGCISMVQDEKGFLYPVADAEKCVHCGLCEKVCPVYFDEFADGKQERAWAGRHRSEKVLFESSSGGAFTAVYQQLLQEGYVVFGVTYDRHMQVVYSGAQDESGCETFRKSKYVLGDTNHCFIKISNLLRSGKRVAFSGTPCICAALQSFLKIKKVSADYLVVIDLICHGAPNQKLFDKYIAEAEAQTQAEIQTYQFKNKEPVNGKVNSRTASVTFDSGEKQLLTAADDPFLKGYYNRLFYRDSCGVCPFARPDRVSDITLGDAWNIEALYPEWNSTQGVSLIIASTGKGKSLIDKIKNEMALKPVDMEWAVQNNEQLRRPTGFHRGREKFFEYNASCRFCDAVELALNVSFIRRIGRKIKRMILSGN